MVLKLYQLDHLLMDKFVTRLQIRNFFPWRQSKKESVMLKLVNVGSASITKET